MSPKEILKKNLLYILVLVVAAATFVVSGVLLIDRLMPPSQNLTQYKSNSPAAPSPENPGEKVYTNPVDFAALKEKNPDIYGWITVDGTLIDYPVLRSGPDKEEDFYLTHDYLGEEQRYGSIFMQRLNAEDFTDSNTVLYGHNMLSGAMFGQLKKFKSREFFDNNRYIYVYTPDAIRKYEIFSAFVSDNRNILRAYNFYYASGYQAFINHALDTKKTQSVIRSGVKPQLTDNILTLSTCTSDDSARYIVVGVLVETMRTEKK